MNIVLYPQPKINIGLRVLARRSDGYHDIETLFYPVDTYTDILEIIEADSVSMTYFGTAYELPGGDMEKELCIKAYRLLQKEFGLPPVGIYLYKNIPVGAGMGGGSSDAAWTLRGLNELFGLGLSGEQLASYASRLGSDCPFFIYGTPMLGQGRGEILTPCCPDSVAGLKERYHIKIAAPGIHVSTAEAYASLSPDPSGKGLTELLSMPVEQWKDRVVNDFEKTVFAKYPQLERIKRTFYDEGAVYASMSGSGSAVYGIFPNNI
ncbi:MAG TPA: 4-(cytidine 5'-diphospho)-2-C-methyl-D-erythritol kinase [Candidatus Coprenecus stercoravium]|uniref:4-diphosphocytidyl-2-C-methyl-D-erythritol kinase n=1 Tax=Candidatus Coprenecus stercoravium TaxID=2840735 RepID=A0A9D2K899_9BACT|nr:4-(cytidine 5'-diphospho)-2-C-methyl-D-erythritol kinase [Candidatus Coprenecus stercoravium]